MWEVTLNVMRYGPLYTRYYTHGSRACEFKYEEITQLYQCAYNTHVQIYYSLSFGQNLYILLSNYRQLVSRDWLLIMKL